MTLSIAVERRGLERRGRRIPTSPLPALLLLGPLLAACVYEPPMVAPLPRGPAPVAAAPSPPRPPATFTVQPGDGLNAVAQNLNVPRGAIIDANGLKPPYGLRIGQVLRIPPVTGYRVEPGQSLTAIAQARGVPVTQLAELNHLSPPYALRSGSELVMPLPPTPPPAAAQPPLPAMTPYPPPPIPYGSTAPMRPPLGTAVGAAAPLPNSEPVVPPPAPPIPPPPSSAAGRTAFPTTPLAGEGAPPAPLGRPSPPAAAVAGAPLAPLPGSTTSTGPITSVPPPAAPIAGAPVTLGPPRSVAAAEPPAPPKGGKSFLWPVRGRIVSGFGSATEGEKNDGINIASPKGTPINAAESGVVVYVGNELRSFGNLMLIKHPDGWYTAYAHADSFLVKKGDTVRRGQPIGRVGTVGSSGDSQLHFEIRRGEKPVDPSEYLPQLNS